jgi:multidrug efflux pump subunit AcrA (membrane-fusion protein)
MASSEMAKNANPGTATEASNLPSNSRYRLRADLEIVGAGGGLPGSEVTIIDPRSGERHVFTADEFRLFRAADGTNTLAAIRQTFKAETGHDLPHGKLFAFFRRLRGLGLLEEAAVDDPNSANAASSSVATQDVEEKPLASRSGQANEPDEFESLPLGSTLGGRPGQRAIRRGSRDASAAQATSGKRARSRSLTSLGDAGGLRRSDVALRERIDAGDHDVGGLDFGAAESQSFRARIVRSDWDDAAASSGPARLSFFDPNPVFGGIATLLRPLKYLLLPVILAVLAGFWLTYDRRELLAEDFRTFDVSLVALVIAGLVIVNFFTQLLQGIVIRGLGAAVPQFGIALMFGIPRFFTDLGGIGALNRRGQLWAHTAPLIARLAVFCAGIFVWLGLRETAPALSQFALVVGLLALLVFLLTAWPLLPSDGYRWLATYLARPTLSRDALRTVTAHTESDGGRFIATDKSPVIFYATAVVLAGAAAALLAQAYFEIVSGAQIAPLTAILLLVVTVASAVWAFLLLRYGRRSETPALDAETARQLRGNWAGQGDLFNDRPTTVAEIGKIFWALLAVLLLAIAFLPYRYRAGGTFEILPTQRTVVTVRTAGAIEQISVREGDWVAANQVLAKLSTKDAQREVTMASTELQRARAQLAQFGGDNKQTGAKDSVSELDKSIADALGDDSDSASKKNNAVAADYTKSEAERVARTDVERLTRKLAFARDQLSETTVRAPAAGRVMTPNLQLLIGTYLHRGAELLTLDDTRTLQAEINLPEADVDLVRVGDNVRLRPWANEDREISGNVTEIAPAAQVKSYGTIVRVEASIPHADETLRPAMTGYAKIDGENMRVWQAFLRRIIQIVRVEFWSWIP